MEFTGSVSEAEAKGLKIGQSLPFEADGRSGMARITGLATGGDPVSHRGTLRARVVQGAGGPALRRLRPAAGSGAAGAPASQDPSIPR